MAMLPKLYSPKDLSQTLAIPLGTIYKWLESGRLRGRRVGKHVRILEADVAKLLDLSDADLRAPRGQTA